jgi:hypothetical protein
MRLGRILVAGLAPLIGFSALVLVASGQSGLHARNPEQGADPLARFLRSVVQLATAPAEFASVSASPERPSPQAVLAFSALAATAFRHSLWLLASLLAVNFLARRHQRALLRC